MAASFTENLQDLVIHRLKSSGAVLGHIMEQKLSRLIYAYEKDSNAARLKTGLYFESNIPHPEIKAERQTERFFLETPDQASRLNLVLH